MMAHENAATRDESVKRGGGSVTAVEIRKHHKGPQISYATKFMCR